MTLLPLAILTLLYVPFVFSLPLLSLNGTSVVTLDVAYSPFSNSTRSLWEIIWSCAATLFACTWTAIHPNIPGMNEGEIAIVSRRLGIMMMALIAPELMITWATIQFISARSTAKDFNDVFGAQLHVARSDHSDMGESTATLLRELLTPDGMNGPHVSASHIAGRKFRGWTVTHGFFAWMGGFMLYVNDEPRATLTPKELLGFVRDGSVEMPVIVKPDIEDRSKGDALSKGIAILQLAWFILQLVTRYVQNLPITLLELDTLAVAALTGIAYGFWWNKPKDVGRPHAVYWKATLSPPSKLDNDKVDAIFSSQGWYDIFLTCIYPLPSLMGGEISNSPRAVHSRRVPSVGGYDMKHSKDHRMVILLIGCFSAAVFGGIHCLAWNVLFPGHAEQMLWRVASLAIVSVSASIFLQSSYFNWRKKDSFVIRVSVQVVSFFVYIVARITLIVLVLMSFRSLPPGVYDTVAWTRFIPHL
ncbi:hypothetical protein BDR04DRAFT_1099910 [Suillus decipiens]|nr:hypothetical protein BDR04DRAFT_1099910 [Suillus decipiens]